MEDFTSHDLNRMMLSIEHESNARIKEIGMESQRECSALKDELVEKGKREIAREYSGKLDALMKHRKRSEARMRGQLKINMLEAKTHMVDKMVRRAEETLRSTALTEELIWECAEKIDSADYFVFCMERDRLLVEECLKTRGVEYLDVRELPERALGGIALCRKDGRVVWDNSFLARLQQLLGAQSDEIGRLAF